jgi:heavy metal efflux system protein
MTVWTDYFARASRWSTYLRNVNRCLPEQQRMFQLNPNDDPSGEIFRYTLEGKGKTVMELKTIQDWVCDHQFRMVQGVADVNTYGGPTKMYEMDVDPALLKKYGITAQDVWNAAAASNINSGGDVVEQGMDTYVVRGIGLLKNLHDIENIIIKNVNGIPLLVKNVANVKVNNEPRLGQVGRDTNCDAVLGVVLNVRGTNPEEVLKRIDKKVDELNNEILPVGVKIVPFYKRSTLIHECKKTIWSNVGTGILLVILLVFIFLIDWRCTLIIAIIIPLSLLFSYSMLKTFGMDINLFSLGAVDYGIIIDGTIVLVEGAFVLFSHYYGELGP